MAKPQRFVKTTRTWIYVGQSKQHQLTDYSPLDAKWEDEAAKRNANDADGIVEYKDACESGTVRILRFETELVP